MSGLALLLFLLFWTLNIMFGEDDLVEGKSLVKLLDKIMIAVALLIVCIPEGLPLAISIAMAFTVDKLKEDNLLIKNLSALETSGSLIDIMTGKTGTLTEGNMRVVTFQAGVEEYNPKNPQINQVLLSLIKQLIILNTEAKMEIEDESNSFVPKGSPVEVALLNFLIDNDEPVQLRLEERERGYKLHTFIPFSSERRLMTVAYQLPHENVVRVVVKGAPEEVMRNCT